MPLGLALELQLAAGVAEAAALAEGLPLALELQLPAAVGDSDTEELGLSVPDTLPSEEGEG